MFFEYGDDSVAQLGGVHLACEQASNLLTKVLEWGRLMAYLEQSTRYIPYDSRLHGRYRYLRPSEVCESRLGARYVADMDAIFDTYSAMLPDVIDWARERLPEGPGRLRLRLQADDQGQGVRRGARRPARGDAVERRHLRHRAGVRGDAAAHARAPAAGGAHLRAADARRAAKVIPSFLARVDRPDRGGAWTAYLHDTAGRRPPSSSHGIFGAEPEAPTADEVTLVDWDPDGEDKVLAAICYPHTHLPEAQLLDRVRRLPADDRVALMHGVRR